MRPTVLLFDIDGTLISSGGAGRRALENAFRELHGREDACQSFRMDGMTDRAIVQQGLAALGVPITKAAVDAILDAYLELLRTEVREASDASYRLHPGMQHAVDTARAMPNVAVGLGTGNIRPGARIKLERVGIYDRFGFGGFGCDDDNRVELIRQGAQRGANALGMPAERCRVVVIGDTPKDVLAAKGIGAECIGVGTGHFRPEELLEAGADAAFLNLEAPGALEVLLGTTGG